MNDKNFIYIKMENYQWKHKELYKCKKDHTFGSLHFAEVCLSHVGFP